jgi:S-adenosylmethionine decarboxylase
MKHILFTLKECNKSFLDDEQFVRDVVYQASVKCQSTLLALHSHKFDPQGVTCVAMLAESHISIHTWPENGMAVCDIFTCGEHTKPKKGVAYMQMMFNAQDIVSSSFKRPLE